MGKRKGGQMNIAVATSYGNIYDNDKLFDLESCKIGENLLLPGIMLKNRIEELGHKCHTADLYNFSDIDVLVFQDLNKNSRLLLSSPLEITKYIAKRKWKYDYLYKYTNCSKKIKSILIIQEPPIICPQSYDLKYHTFFDKVLTWNNDLIDNKKYFPFFYPQVLPQIQRVHSFEKKKYLTMICGNKTSNFPNELYSKRKSIIEYFEHHNEDFDLYGIGWSKNKYQSYRGAIDKKISILSQYKFAVCFENMCNIKGYITEKIFDCFFAGCIPIYWGAENIDDYIPKDTFIDYREYGNIKKLNSYLKGMSSDTYCQYLNAIDRYLNSKDFKRYFSVESYIERMLYAILN